MSNREEAIQFMSTVLNAMAEVIETKGAKNKMVSVFEIRAQLQKQDVIASLIEIESALDKLVATKLVRYYKHQESGYVFWGVTQYAWSKREQRLAKEVETKEIEQIYPPSDVVDVKPELEIKVVESNIKEDNTEKKPGQQSQ